MSGTGGTGSGYHAKIVIDQAGFYTISCGTGGVSYGAGRGGAAQTQPTNGGASSLVRESDGETIISAGGGTKGQAWINGCSAGSAGVLTKMSGLEETTVYVSTNGKNGSSRQTENSNTVDGQNGPISGKTWGSTGRANGSPGGGRVGSAHHGFIWIKYVDALSYTLTINPTPSDATVTLTADGYEQSGNTITVKQGVEVSWKVEKNGYQTKQGTWMATQNETMTVTLIELSEPDLYVFRGSNGNYYYFPVNPMDWDVLEE